MMSEWMRRACGILVQMTEVLCPLAPSRRV